jgi:hypothetical protein
MASVTWVYIDEKSIRPLVNWVTKEDIWYDDDDDAYIVAFSVGEGGVLLVEAEE